MKIKNILNYNKKPFIKLVVLGLCCFILALLPHNLLKILLLAVSALLLLSIPTLVVIVYIKTNYFNTKKLKKWINR